MSHPFKGVWAGFVEEDYNAEPDPQRVNIRGDVDELPLKAGPVWLSCPESFRPL